MRVSVARRNLFSDPTRLAISVGGVAVAILLIIVLLAVYTGSLRQMSAYVDNVDADLWVAQAGSPDMLHSFSVVPAIAGRTNWRKVDGVSEVWPLTSRTTLVDIGDKKNSLILVGYQPGGAGGPWKMSEGRGEPGPRRHRRRQGDDEDQRSEAGRHHRGRRPELRDRRCLRGHDHHGGPVCLRRYRAGEEGAGAEPHQLHPGEGRAIPPQRDRIKEEIAAAHPEQTVFTREQFSSNNSAVIREGILPVLAVVVVIAFIIGVAIVGLVVYSATLEKYREYGVLKAVGASSAHALQDRAGAVAAQRVAGLRGGGGGLVRRWRGSSSRIVVQISVAFTWQHFASAFVAAIVMSVIASYIPARKINNIDPVIVFKA